MPSLVRASAGLPFLISYQVVCQMACHALVQVLRTKARVFHALACPVPKTQALFPLLWKWETHAERNPEIGFDVCENAATPNQHLSLSAKLALFLIFSQFQCVKYDSWSLELFGASHCDVFWIFTPRTNPVLEYWLDIQVGWDISFPFFMSKLQSSLTSTWDRHSWCVAVNFNFVPKELKRANFAQLKKTVFQTCLCIQHSLVRQVLFVKFPFFILSQFNFSIYLFQVMAVCSETEDEFSCGICFEEYQPGDLRPKLLPCSHTLCLKCLQKLPIKNNKISCPQCNQKIEFPSDGVSKFPTNRYILDCQRLVIKKEKLALVNDTLTKENHTLTKENKNLHDQKENLALKNDTLGKENEKLLEENQKISDKCNILVQENEKLIKQKQKEAKGGQCFVNEKKSFVKESQNTILTLKKENQKLVTEKDLLAKEIRKLTKQKNKMAKRKDKLTRRNAELETSIAEESTAAVGLKTRWSCVFAHKSWKTVRSKTIMAEQSTAADEPKFKLSCAFALIADRPAPSHTLTFLQFSPNFHQCVSWCWQNSATRMLDSIVSCLASPTAPSSPSLICNPNLSLYHHKYRMGAAMLDSGCLNKRKSEVPAGGPVSHLVYPSEFSCVELAGGRGWSIQHRGVLPWTAIQTTTDNIAEWHVESLIASSKAPLKTKGLKK